MPTAELTADDMTDGEIDIMTMLSKSRTGIHPNQKHAVQYSRVELLLMVKKLQISMQRFKAEDMSRRRSCTEKRKEEFP